MCVYLVMIKEKNFVRIYSFKMSFKFWKVNFIINFLKSFQLMFFFKYIRSGEYVLFFEFYLPGIRVRGVWMKTFGFCSIDVQDSNMISVCQRPRGKNRDNIMLPDLRNFRVVFIIVLQITPIIMKIKEVNFLASCRYLYSL